MDLAIRLFGPANVTSILDRETFNYKLADITKKLEIYIEKAEDIKEELYNFEDDKVDTVTECDRKKNEINSLTEAIIKKVHDNEYEIKKKMEDIINASDACPPNSKTNSKAPQPARKNSNRKDKTDQSPEHSSLSDKIAKYCETGLFFSNLPEFVYTCKFMVSQYQKKLPLFG